MSSIHSYDPRAVRTRQALQDTFIELLQTKPYQKITVTDITRGAGFARHTFYNHYETKDDLLAEMIDSVFEDFYSKLGKWDINITDTDKEISVISAFFSVWKENEVFVRVLNNLDIDDLLIKRLKVYFTNFYYEQVSQEIPGVDLALADYMISFNAYTLLGILKPWLQDGMRHPPEVMAEFLILLTGSTQRRQAVERFKSVIK